MEDAGSRHATVAVPAPVRRLFTYAVGEDLAPRVARGSRVRVPFGGRRVVGTIVDWPAPAPEEGIEVKAVDGLAAEPQLGTDLLELTSFVSDYYLCSWGEAIEAALPPGVGVARPRRVVCLVAGLDAASLPARAPARRALVARLAAQGGSLPLDRLSPAERRALGPLVRAGCIEIREVSDEPIPTPGPREAPPVLTAPQGAALGALDTALRAETFRAFLLYGATGSGKTEVYLGAARAALERGRGVLWLVPEIGLTPLLLGTIERRFPLQAAVLHSGLGPAARQAAWERVRSGRARLVLGTRSAVFAPVRDLGLVVVDEEQDASYKQAEAPRYHGRDVAVVRARQSKAVIVLGSATPSLESFQHARAGRYALLRLGGRIEDRPLPAVRVIDMREEYRRAGAVTPLSRELAAELRACVERGEQALVLRNRRGWASALHCPGCGERVECPRCSVALTWHRGARRLRCHYCGFERGYPEACPGCGHAELHALGEGTERIEALLAEALPGARIERMDRDTIRRRGEHERVLRRFERGEIDVLVGTQMIAKGHDFPRVTLVGVLSADQPLGLPDFRAAERTFQLLTQVAGRAGRGALPGRVIVQAFDAAHPVLELAAAQDYDAFFERELRYRRALRYPPLAALVLVRVQHADEAKARSWADIVAAELRGRGAERLMVSGPGPAPLARLDGRWRQQILVRTAGRRRLVEAVDRALRATAERVPRVALHVDVDPMSLL